MESQSYPPFAKWVTKLLSDPTISMKINKTGIQALNMPKRFYPMNTRRHRIVSGTEIMFSTRPGEFGPTLEDVDALTLLPMFADSSAIHISLDEEIKKSCNP